MNAQPDTSLAKLTWEDPTNLQPQEFVLLEGGTASIGRAPENDICIAERHVSRQHAVIAFRDGVFVITDLGSANKTFVNDHELTAPFPLAHGDVIRLYVPTINFSAFVTPEEEQMARTTGHISIPPVHNQPPSLRVTASPSEEGAEFVLTRDLTTIGRATTDSTWDISLRDPAVSRPHCRIQKKGDEWLIVDLGGVNKTFLNQEQVTGTPRSLKDGDVLLVGHTTLLFRQT